MAQVMEADEFLANLTYLNQRIALYEDLMMEINTLSLRRDMLRGILLFFDVMKANLKSTEELNQFKDIEEIMGPMYRLFLRVKKICSDLLADSKKQYFISDDKIVLELCDEYCAEMIGNLEDLIGENNRIITEKIHEKNGKETVVGTAEMENLMFNFLDEE